MVTTFGGVAALTGLRSGLFAFLRSPFWMGEWGAGREWGVDGDNFWCSCSADGPTFGTFAFLRSPFLMGEGDGEGVGSEW